MIRLSLQVPTAHLGEFEQYQDFIFVNHPCLEDKDYRNYMQRNTMRKYLDNGYNETRQGVSLDDLLRPRGIVYNAIVAPDMPDDVRQHIDDLRRLRQLGHSQRIGVLKHAYHQHWQQIVHNSDIVALARQPGYERYYLLQGHLPYPKPIHFLGLGSLDELVRCQGHVSSVDTSLPIKLALSHTSIEDYTQRTSVAPDFNFKATHTALSYVDLILTPVERVLAHRNCAVLQRVCQGQTITEATANC